MIKPKLHDPEKVNTQYTTCDIETRRSGVVMDIGLAWWEKGERNYEVFTNWGDFLDFIILHGKHACPQLRTIYAHNGGKFDWLSLLHDMISMDLIEREKINVVMSGASAIGIDITLPGKNGSIRLRDSLRLLPASLKKLSQTLSKGYEKIDLTGEHPEDLKDRDETSYYEYLKHDCFALQDILENFHLMINARIGLIEKLPLTLAALALILWRDYYLDTEIMTPWNDVQKQFEQQAYLGGRVEVFAYGEFEHVNVYDVNSEYPAVMREGVFPMSYHTTATRTFRDDMLGIYEIEFEQPTGKPALLLIYDDKSKALRSTYKGRGVFCSPEIKKLLDLGGTIKVIRGMVYPETGNPFTNFINTLYGLRREAQEVDDEALAYTCKILMNSLYGKFGQKNEATSLRTATAEDMRKMLEKGTKFTNWGDFIQLEERKPVEHQFFAMAAFITCYARLKLYSFMERVDIVLYCDTDSVHTPEELPAECLGSELGMMKLEYTGRGAYAGKKLYALMNEKYQKVKAKGITIGGESGDRGLDYEEIRKLATDKSRKYHAKFSSPPTPKEVLLLGKKPAIWYNRTRTIRRT